MTNRITNSRVITASFFLPYTVDVELVEKRESIHPPPPSTTTNVTATTTTNLEPTVEASTIANTNVGPRNLIDTLAAQKRHIAPPVNQSEQELFTLESQQQNQNDKTTAAADIGGPSLSFPLAATDNNSETVESTRATDTARVARNNDDHDDSGIHWKIKPCISGNIGLQNAIQSIRHRLDQHVWVGTTGTSSMDCLPSSTKEKISCTLIDNYQSYPIIPTDAVFDGHYNRYCKQVKRKRSIVYEKHRGQWWANICIWVAGLPPFFFIVDSLAILPLCCAR